MVLIEPSLRGVVQFTFVIFIMNWVYLFLVNQRLDKIEKLLNEVKR